MADQFTTSFSLGPLCICFGFLFLTVATYISAIRFKSVLLRIVALGFLVCTFTAAVSIAMPIRFRGNIWPPAWVSWLTLVGMPVVFLITGIVALVFAVRRNR